MRPSQILISEKLVTNVIKVLEEEYINPFGVGYDGLHNLSSGEEIKEDLASSILNVYANGEEMKNDFVNSRIISESVKLHTPEKRCTVTTFKTIMKPITVKSKHMQASVEINRNILGALLAFSVKNERPISLSAALAYPLSPLPLSLATGDGKRRETSKSKLTSILIENAELKDPKTDDSIKEVGDFTFVIDLIAAIRTMTVLPNTYEELVWNLISTLPKGYRRLDIVADTYRNQSIKDAERSARGSSQKVIIGSSKSKIPRDFSNFMRNKDNKTRLVEIISEVMRNNYASVLAKLRCSVINISQEDVTYCLKRSGVSIHEELSSNQEEADTKVILHCYHSMQEYSSSKVALRSPSGDTDILILAVSLLDINRVYLDYGKGKLRKGIWLNDLSIEEQMKEPLIGFHAFTGNDYVSSFFKKGKQLCWNGMKKNQVFIEAFRQLGQRWIINENDEIISSLEKYICHIYGYPRENSVNVVRMKMFEKKYDKDGKIIDVSLLPPCKSVLMLHIKRANYVAKLWRSSLTSWLNPEEIADNGWFHDGSINWVDEVFPDDVEEILCDPTFKNDEFDEDDELSEDDDE